MSSIQLQRIASQIAKEISNIIMLESRDYNFKSVTITGANVSSDLSFAKVYFTVIDDENKDSILKELNEASSFFRKEISERIDLRHTPKISFIYDKSIEYGNNIEKIINDIHENK